MNFNESTSQRCQAPLASNGAWHLRMFAFSLWSLVFSLPLHAATNDNQRAARLGLLRQATGTSSGESTSGFESRVNMIFEPVTTGPTAERTYIDQTMPAQTPVQSKVMAEEIASTALLDKLKKETSPRENARGKLSAKDEFKSELNKPMDEKIHMKEDIQQLMDYKAKKDRDEETEAQNTRKKSSHLSSTSKNEFSDEVTGGQSELRPSLANNPFYFSEESRRDFNDNKPVIISRLVQAGYTRLEAENLVMTASNPEEAILALMQNEGMKYGQAQEFVGTSGEREG